jgi:RNA polymerase sigma-70 factor (ECF subfamily)
VAAELTFSLEQDHPMRGGQPVRRPHPENSATDQDNAFGRRGMALKRHPRLPVPTSFFVPRGPQGFGLFFANEPGPSDPTRCSDRQSTMITGIETLQKPDAGAPPPIYGVPRNWRPRRTGKAVPEGAEAGWIDVLARIRMSRDQAAFAELFRHFASGMKAFLMTSGASPARAAVATWIFAIARNRRIDLLRRKRPEPEDLSWGPGARTRSGRRACAAPGNRPAEPRAAPAARQAASLIERAYYGALTHSEIAAETGLPLGTIKSRIRLALARLRHELK